MKNAVSWDRAKVALLRASYAKAAARGDSDFTLSVRPEGPLRFVTAYAKYLLEYLDAEMRAHPDTEPRPNKEGPEPDGEATW